MTSQTNPTGEPTETTPTTTDPIDPTSPTTDTPVYDWTTPTDPLYSPYDRTPIGTPQSSSTINSTNCDEKDYVECVKDALDCIEGVSSRSDICQCNQKASACLVDAGCGPGNEPWEKFYDACINNDGCTAAQCSSATTFTLVLGFIITVTHILLI